MDVKIRILCSLKKDVSPGLYWLIGFLIPSSSSFIIASTLRCLHTLPSDDYDPHITIESDELRSLLPKGFQVIGAFIIHNSQQRLPTHAISAARNLSPTHPLVIGALFDLNNLNVDVQFFVSDKDTVERIDDGVVYEQDHPHKFIWDRACLIRCQLPLKLPLFYSSTKDVEVSYAQCIQQVEHKLRDPQVTYIIESQTKASSQPAIIHGADLDQPELPTQSKSLACSHFCSVTKDTPSLNSAEEFADKIEVSIMFNRSRSPLTAAAPTAEYYPVNGEAKLVVVKHTLEMLAYATKDQLLTHVISNLIIPGLVDQLHSLKIKILPNLLEQQPLLQPYHFMPSGFVHPVTVFYELSYGETEMKQVEVRKALHLRLGLPFDRPLLRIANALNISSTKDNTRDKSNLKGSTLLKDVHLNIPSSGVSGGNISLIQGSYEYYHYLQDGFDDSGWGCAYRSLQTIISWFKHQHYTSIDVPSHREIQQALVEIGDKDPSFVGSREWIGAIELSFVLDKLLGVSCKVITMRSGAEFPEKCREIASHFKNQGTPIMIGGGVLAYTLLGVDYNDVSGDCAFLILDPHYTGNEDLKKIVNGGWCGWKKSVDSKGKPFFLHDKFYNLLLPQRPSMIHDTETSGIRAMIATVRGVDKLIIVDICLSGYPPKLDAVIALRRDVWILEERGATHVSYV